MLHLVTTLGLFSVVIGHLNNGGIFLGFKDGDNIGERDLGARLASGVVWKHNAHVATNHTGTHFEGAGGLVDVDLVGVTTLDHVAVVELGSLRTGTTKLTGNDYFSTLSTRLHDEAKHTVGGTTAGEAAEKLVAKGLALGLGVEATVGNALSVKLNGTFGEVESHLHDGGELTDALALLSKNVLGVGGTDDDFSAHGGYTHFNAGVTFLADFTGEELVELGVEDAIGDEFADLGDRRHCAVGVVATKDGD